MRDVLAADPVFNLIPEEAERESLWDEFVLEITTGVKANPEGGGEGGGEKKGKRGDKGRRGERGGRRKRSRKHSDSYSDSDDYSSESYERERRRRKGRK